MDGTNVQYMEDGDTITIIDPQGREVDVEYIDGKFIVREEHKSGE